MTKTYDFSKRTYANTGATLHDAIAAVNVPVCSVISDSDGLPGKPIRNIKVICEDDGQDHTATISDVIG